jgi:hypothetical protein
MAVNAVAQTLPPVSHGGVSSPVSEAQQKKGHGPPDRARAVIRLLYKGFFDSENLT